LKKQKVLPVHEILDWWRIGDGSTTKRQKETSPQSSELSEEKPSFAEKWVEKIANYYNSYNHYNWMQIFK